MLNFLSFAISASLIGPLKVGVNFDVIFVHEPSPITVGLPAIVMKLITRAPIVFWVLDLWPDSVEATGAARSKLLIRLLDRLVRLIYRYCDLVLISSRAFSSRISAQGVGVKQIRYLPNWAESVFTQLSRNAPPPYPLPIGFRIIFAGNIGAAQDFPTILDAAQLLKNEPEIHWIILGNGRQLQWVENEVIKRGLSESFHLLGQRPVEEMPAFFAYADIMLVSLRNQPIFSLTVPAKLQAYLACGRPILCMLNGEGARIVKEANAGACCPPGNHVELAKTVLQLKSMGREGREELGRNGYRYSQLEFSRSVLLGRLEDWLTEATIMRTSKHPS